MFNGAAVGDRLNCQWWQASPASLPWKKSIKKKGNVCAGYPRTNIYATLFA